MNYWEQFNNAFLRLYHHSTMKKSPTLSQIWCSKVRLRLHFAYILSEQRKGGVLHLDDPIETKNGQRKVRDIPLEKHPPCQPIYHDTIIIVMTPLMFTPSYSNLWMLMWIRSAALHTSGAAGPSGLDILGWRRLCTSFKTAFVELCHSLALAAKRLYTELVDLATIAHSWPVTSLPT